MNSRYLQNLLNPVNSVHGESSAPHYLLPGGNTNPLGSLVCRLRAMLGEIDRKRREAYENRKAIAHLESLTDEQLRDIGIARELIERSVRHGREAV